VEKQEAVLRFFEVVSDEWLVIRKERAARIKKQSG